LPRDIRRTDIAGVRTRPALPLADELALGLWFRKRYSWVGDHRMDGILHYIACAGLKDLIRHGANFGWHRKPIVELRKRLTLGRLGVRTLFSL
jgi:hypothetical protein